MPALLVIFVHGWSVTNTDTYGELPARLIAEAAKTAGPKLDVQHIYLGQYVSFRDEVRIADISRAFNAALGAVLKDAGANRRFVCITHSTGGPVVRDWLDRYFVQTKLLAECPMSHLIMLAPANFGSALAQLGKTRLAAIKSWFDGVEPGQGVLDWLELGSPEATALNLRWIDDYPKLKLTRGTNPLFQFVLSGDTIDRKLYDFVNPYTGEIGSDGVVRLAAANLNATHIVLEQPAVEPGEALPSARKRLRSLLKVSSKRSATTAFKIIAGASHSGESKGIMRSVHNDDIAHVSVDAILRCLKISDADAYASLCQAFATENAARQDVGNRLEVEKVPVLPDREYIHDPRSMVIFRLIDSQGIGTPDVKVLLTAGPNNDPNQLPENFLTDRQFNKRSGNLTFFLNHAALAGCAEIPGLKPGKVARPALIPRQPYGLRIQPRDDAAFVEYWAAELHASVRDLLPMIPPNETTIIDIRLTRVVREGVFRLTRTLTPRSFKNVEPGGAL
ncbi:MAG TPA: phospholipase [Dokdonella sp.]|uniref:esterase/lipase family protein n=1 Tax=Dokdonella sp. TaxID=2291710 RepID=UPI002D801860|nr:phospholipase [Dokdonella sp.]HET9033717.1 phospholipase [Dokdonella sp.]